MTKLPICPCEGFIHPRIITNLPAQDTIAYRVGDFASFRRALLQSLPKEVELHQWNPTAQSDLAMQMVEWWAYLADILTFYNERIANQAYLRTADLPESLQRLIRVLGYRPRPGIGARGVVLALTNSTTAFILPRGFQIQSKPGPGKQPQIFELDADTTIAPTDAIAVEPVSDDLLLQDKSVLLQGKVTTVKEGDELLLLSKDWPENTNYAVVTVSSLQTEKDPHGKVNTRVKFKAEPDFKPAVPLSPPPKGQEPRNDRERGSSLSGKTLSGQKEPVLYGQLVEKLMADDYLLLKSTQTAHVWPYSNTDQTAISNKNVHLAVIARQIQVNDPILIQLSDKTPPNKLVRVTDYSEIIWDAKPGQLKSPVPIPHTYLNFCPSITSWINNTNRTKALIHYGWQEVGKLIPTPQKTVTTANLSLFAMSPAKFHYLNNQWIVIEDATGQGIKAKGTLIDNILTNKPPNLNLSDLPDTPEKFTSPLQVLFNLLPVSRGQTVPQEILGSGDASLAGQEFVLQKSPLTYLMTEESTSGSNYTSTLHIWVDDVEWQEVPSFYGQGPNAHIFVTREDEDNKTYVQFGDGVHGARLPTGIDNVVATYRYGSGREAPEAGTLNVILKPYPKLKVLRNPVAVGGGADPDSPEQIRRDAPRSVLTFGRAVSGDDYEAIAARTPGVARARAYWTWDDKAQRTLVKIYVGDDEQAVESARTVLKKAIDPNRPLKVELAKPIRIKLSLSLRLDPAYDKTKVKNSVSKALLDSEGGLFGSGRIGIGESIYRSQIYAACMGVTGVLAVSKLEFKVYKEETSTLKDSFPKQPVNPTLITTSANEDKNSTSTATSIAIVNQSQRKQVTDTFKFKLEYSYDLTQTQRTIEGTLDTSHRHDPGEGKFYQLSKENLEVDVEGN